jgi:hypothetical protein
VTEIAGQRVRDEASVSEALSGFAPGDRVAISFEKRGEARKREMVLQGDPSIEVVPFERTGREVTAAVARFRESWLSSRVTGN